MKKRLFHILIVVVRALNALVGLWWYWMESAADGIVHLFVKTEYARTGSCRRCGVCCRLLAVEMPMWMVRRDRLIALVVRWHEAVLNFEFKGRDGRFVLYSCRHCREAPHGDDTRAVCGIHFFRPRLCRFYPRVPLHGHPALHAGCGYGFRHRDGRLSFNEVLRTVRHR